MNAQEKHFLEVCRKIDPELAKKVETALSHGHPLEQVKQALQEGLDEAKKRNK